MDKKPENLTDNLSASSKYRPSVTPGLPLQGGMPEQVDYQKLGKKLEDFKKKMLKKFPFMISLGILPINAFAMFEEDEGLPKEEVDKKPMHIIMIMPEDQYKNLTAIKKDVIDIAKTSGEKIWVHIKTAEVDIWNYGLDSKFEFIDAIGASFPLYDKGFLGALRVASIHKSLVLSWLNVGRIRYVATYGIFGSLVRGTADETSDVDVTVIIDDTDVKRMSKVELVEKLRGKIVYEYVKEATALAGVKNILNVQVWLLTDFWQRVKDAEPVAFTFIRDGVPLYDRGTFIPWKRLLQMGKIKPSPEAIDLYMKEGDRTVDIIKRRQLDNMVDIYFGVVTPTQAMMMLAGHAPPVPKVIVQEVKKILVDKEKLMTAKELKTLEKVVKLYKDYEHGTLKDVPGKEIDNLLEESMDYVKKMRELRNSLERRMWEHEAERITGEVFNLMKKIFGDKGQEALISDLENEMVKKGKVAERMLGIAKDIAKLKAKVKTKEFTQGDMQRYSRDYSALVEALTEFSQRKELVSMEKGIAKVNFDKGWAELVGTDEGMFLVMQNGEVKKYEKGKFVSSDRKMFEKALKETKERVQFSLPSEVVAALKKEFGECTISF
ncbi:MAG: nucleotidyltransferase domain-containing protein [Nanoarchaeota archaeon]|nr:nucleotidyltransferase domain-containing protein [Nanoarchaeota archaeon]MBU0977580.1 nucleotidyltransferase domain-containing protein [Nanoarchaeota archaeon]